jgi:hypothetical protein
MEMVRVNSSALQAVGYDPATRQMKIAFAQGNIYDFCGVPQRVHEALMRATSKGIYYNEHIKDRYPCH